MQVFGGETGKKTGKLTTTDQENAVIRCTQLKISDIGVVSSNLFTVLDLIGFMIQWLGLEMVTVEVKFRDYDGCATKALKQNVRFFLLVSFVEMKDKFPS